MRDLVVDTCAGPGGWTEGLRRLGIRDLGLELDAAACATRRAAGHRTIRADVSSFPVERLAGKTWGQVHSPPCTTFSAAGDGAGNLITAILGAGIRDAFAGRKTRALRRREMAHVLRVSSWGGDQPGRPCHEFPGADWTWTHKEQDAWKRKLRARKGSPAALRRDMAAGGDGRHPTRARRSAKIWDAVRSASLVIEPARYLHAGQPEWGALEQVPSVLPLWQVYADELGKLGYSTWCGKLNAADYGVPQTRERAILIASRVRKVYRPEPTHYDPRKGMQLWGTPWVSMAEALGWGATGRPGPSVTAGGTATGGAEPFARGGRDALETARDAGQWVVNPNVSGHMRGYRRSVERPAPGLTGQVQNWSLHRSRGASVDRRDHPADEPAPTITGAGGKVGANLSWVHERPSTTVQGGPRIGRPGHKDRDKGESQFAQDSVRISVREAAVLQSFRPDYPWQGSRTKQFEQVGNAVPPLLAAHVAAMATGLSVMECAA